MLQQVEREFEP